jgi:hypothetical protein
MRLKHPKIARVAMREGAGYRAVRTSMELAVSQKVIRAAERAAGEKIVLMPTLGGSVPLWILELKAWPLRGSRFVGSCCLWILKLLRRDLKMHMKMRTVFCALVVLVAMSMATSAFAQVTFTASSTPTSRAIRTGHTELTGTITLTQTAPAGAAGTAGGTLTIEYPGVPITNTIAYGGPITVTGTGVYAGVAFVVNNQAGTIVITMPVVAAGAGAGDTIVVSGVRVGLNGTSFTSLNASLSASAGSGYTITAGQNLPTVISSVQIGLVDSGVALSGTQPVGQTFNVLSNGVIPDATFQFDITENFIDALRSIAQLGGGAINGVNLLMTFAGLPSGVSLSLTSLTINSGGVPAGAINPATPVTVSSSAGLTVALNYDASVGVPDPSTITTVRVAGMVVVAGSATLPLTPANITVQVTLTPNGSALSSSGAAITTGSNAGIPRFQTEQHPATPLVIGSIIPAVTDVLIPYATVIGGFNTGIAIANTTMDPFGTPNGAVQQTGPITFHFFPNTGSTFSYTTSATSPGVGLTSGSVPAGRTYSVLLSELLAAASGPAEFQGYIIAIASFTNAHGQAFITDFAGFTSATEVLILPPPQAGYSRTLGIAPFIGIEALNN